MTALISFIFCAVGASAQVQSATRLPEPALRELARRLLHDKSKAGCKPSNCRILVADVTPAAGESSPLGTQLADQTANDLASLLNPSEVIDRAQLRGYLDKARIPARFLNSDEALRWLGKELRATTILAGTTANQDGTLCLTARLLSSDGKKPGRNEVITVQYDGDLAADLAALDPYSAHNRLPDPIPSPGVFVAGKHGVTSPTCRYCPAPSYSNAARAAKFQGLVILSVVVTADGQVSAAVPLRGAPFGLNETAIAGVQRWQLNPATKEGQPVSVVTAITYHLY